MIVPDINLLVYAYNQAAPHHEQAKAWWEGALNGEESVGLPWAVICGYVRLMTYNRVLKSPLTPEQAMDHVGSWLNVDLVRVLDPGRRHYSILRELLCATSVAAQLTTDAHLAALAIEWQAELHSNDSDFARFSGLRWRNPLSR